MISNLELKSVVDEAICIRLKSKQNKLIKLYRIHKYLSKGTR